MNVVVNCLVFLFSWLLLRIAYICTASINCPSLLCDEELEDLETKNSRGITRKRRRDGEGEVFNQREDEEAGGETGSENKDEEDKETQAGSKHEMEITQVYSIQRSILYSTTGGDHSVSFSQVPGSETVDSCPPPPAKKKRKRIPFSADQLVYLEALFLEDQYPDLQKKRLIAAALGVTPEKMRIWFQNCRTKLRKEQSSITAEVEHRQSRAGYNSSPTHQPVNSTIPTQAPNSKGAPSFSGNFATKVPQLTSRAPSFPTLSNQTVPSHSNLQASLSSPGQSRMRDGGQQQLSSQRELAEYHPHPMHSPPPLHRASAPLFTTTYNPANLIPPFVHTLAHTPPLFLDAVEAGSSFAHCDSQSLQTGTSKGAPSFSGNFATKVPQLTSTAPSFPTLSNQTVPSHSNLQASLSSPDQSRMRDGGQQQLSSQRELAEYHPHPMHSPPPLHRASAPLFTTTYNPANLIPPFVHTLAHTPPLFLDAVEAGSSLAHRDSQSLQTGTRSFFDFGEKLGDLTSSQQNNNLPYKLQPSYPSSQPQHQPQASLPYMAYLPPPPLPHPHSPRF
ncbi:homeobox protein ESX1-like [Acanthopagrus latus]|uniref:homeobox protein ESX1-like n=1 Tax=Acanthopagrus latus TaxID=8177 RepID=UPI00187C1F1B|nr:homeobox protein ESX1-like [Acanthopagrus latus]